MSMYIPDHFNKALADLTPPYHGKRAQAISSALHNCYIALNHIPEKHKKNPASARLIARLEEIMNTDSLENDNDTGLYLLKAKSMNKAELDELIDIVSRLRYLR